MIMYLVLRGIGRSHECLTRASVSKGGRGHGPVIRHKGLPLDDGPGRDRGLGRGRLGLRFFTFEFLAGLLHMDREVQLDNVRVERRGHEMVHKDPCNKILHPRVVEFRLPR